MQDVAQTYLNKLYCIRPLGEFEFIFALFHPPPTLYHGQLGFLGITRV